MKNLYSALILWSEVDEKYIAQTRELPGCIADGKTQEEALKNLKRIQNEWLEMAIQTGRKVSEACTLEKANKDIK